MSWTEINDVEGLPYGGIPYDRIVRKMEETDPQLVLDVTGNDPFYDLEEAPKDYIRSEIIDWSPDAPFLEDEHQKRDPAQARSVLNLRSHGSRGNYAGLPKHPELFIGFTGNDPRGVDNQPRFDKIRANMAARAANLQVSMGVNVGHGDVQVAERPWTNQSISYARKEIDRRIRDRNLKVFTASKEGRPFGRNTNVDSLQFQRVRGSVLRDGDEFIPEQDGGGVDAPSPDYTFGYMSGNTARFGNRNFRTPAQDAEGGDPHARFTSRNADSAPWRHVTHDADLQVQQYGQHRSGPLPEHMVGGGYVQHQSRGDQDHSVSYANAPGHKAHLGASMKQAAAYRKAQRSTEEQHDHGMSMQNQTMGKAAALHDVQRAYHAVKQDAEWATAHNSMVRSGANISQMPHGGFAPSVYDHAQPTSRMSDVALEVARGVKEASAADKRRVKSMVEYGSPVGRSYEMSSPAGSGLRPASDLISINYQSDGTMIRDPTGEGLEVQNYKSFGARKVAEQRQRATANMNIYGRSGAEPNPNLFLERDSLGKYNRPQFYSHTQNPSVTGAAHADTFGWDGEVQAGAGHSGGVGLPTRIRPNASSDDVMHGRFGEESIDDSIGGLDR